MSSVSPSSSPQSSVGRSIVSSLVGRMSPQSRRNSSSHDSSRRSISYGRISDHDDVGDDESDGDYSSRDGIVLSSLEGGERTSPVRDSLSVFCIDDDDAFVSDDDDEYEFVSHASDTDRRQRPSSPPILPSLVPKRSPPANYLCPLTLQPMEDPVTTACGHTFERRALLEWLDESREGACPISRKPLLPLGDESVEADDEPPDYDRFLTTNENLQKRIQEWKLQNPLYQGADPHYAERQRRTMLARDAIVREAGDSGHGKFHHMESSYGRDNEPDDGSGHHPLSRFDRMLLPQERKTLAHLWEQNLREEERESRRRWCWIVLGVGSVTLSLAAGWVLVTHLHYQPPAV